MALRSRRLFSLLGQALNSAAHDTHHTAGPLVRSSAPAYRHALPQARAPFVRSFLSESSLEPRSLAKQAALLQQLNRSSEHERVVDLFEQSRVASNEANLCEYVKALAHLNRLDGTALASHLARGAATAATHSNQDSSWLGSGGRGANGAGGYMSSAAAPAGLGGGLGGVELGSLGTAARPFIISKKEPSFWNQLWQTLRTLLVAFVVASALYAMVDEKGMGGRGVLHNPDLKPQTVSTTKFADVKGVDEAKAELEEVVDYLRNPQRFTTLGGKLPKGVLLVGPPGTGKTMLARAIAGEAGVPFFYTSGSEFEEMFVGVGARRVRDLFKAAKGVAPCIIFIDEIDAIGGSRNPKDQTYMKMTLNQMLVEMDGFRPSDGVIVVAATNFPESLDKALVRPGRFDRHIFVPNPDIKGRQQILEVHFTKVLKAPDVDLEGTPGFSGADLANLVNVAALKAARDNAPAVTQAALEFAKDRITMGAERTSAVLTEESRRLTAYHEGGHALVAIYTAGANAVHKATIVPRGMALGMVMQLPSKDETSVTKRQLMAMLDVAMGGRVAEEMIFGSDSVTTGASSDLTQATRIAKAMVTQYGFSEKIGYTHLTYDETLSTETRSIVEEEIKRLVNGAHERASSLLKKHEAELHKLAGALIERETLTGTQIQTLLGIEEDPPEATVSIPDLVK